MNAILRLLIESTIILSGFYSIYLVFFANDKNFKFNRIYLISSSFLSIVIPQINIPILSMGQSSGLIPIRIHDAVQLPEIIISDINHKAAFSGIDISLSNLILIVYMMGITFFLGKFLIEIFNLLIFIHRNPENIEKRSFYKLIYTGGKLPTSSFFKYLFWNETIKLNRDEKKQIIRHEEGHIAQFHSIDVLYLELLRIIFWFNPFMHSYRKAIATVHEYLADEYVMKKSADNHYLDLLARQVLISCNLSFNNHFSKSRTIKRIRMIKSNHHKPALLRWSLSLSIIALMFYIFSCDSNEAFRKINTAATQFPDIESTDIITPAQIESVTYRKTVEEWIKNNPGKRYALISSSMPRETMNRIFATGDWEIPTYYVDRYQEKAILYAVACYKPGYLFKISDAKDEIPGSEKIDINNEEVFNLVDVQPEPEEGLAAFLNFIGDHIRYPEETKEQGIEGKVFVRFVITKNGDISHVQVIKGIEYGMDDEAVRVVTSYDKKWKPGMKNGKAVNTEMVLPITFKLG